MKLVRLPILCLFITQMSFAQSFKYTSQDNSGKGKFDRINEIEDFLSKLEKNIGELKNGLQKETSIETLKLSKRIDSLQETEIKELKEKLNQVELVQQTLKKSLDDLKSTSISSEKFEELMKNNESLKTDVHSMQTSLKSIQELMSVYESLQNRGSPIKREEEKKTPEVKN